MPLTLITCRLGLWIALVLAGAAGFCGPSAQAQAAPSAFGPGRSLWAGAEYSNVDASFPYGSNTRLWGIGGFVDYNRTPHFSAEAEVRFLRFDGYHGEGEDSYLAGPRYRFRRFGRFQPQVQFLVGLSRMHYPYDIGTMQYLTLAPAGGVNYALTRKLLVRAEYEVQFWPQSPNLVNEPNHPLRPEGIHVGIAYRILR